MPGSSNIVNVVFKVSVDDKGVITNLDTVTKGMKQVETQAKKTGKAASDSFTSFGTVLKDFIAHDIIGNTTERLIRLGSEIFNLSISMDQANKQAKILFGAEFEKYTEKINKMAEGGDKTAYQLTQMAISSSRLLQSMDMTAKQANEMAIGLLEAADAVENMSAGAFESIDVNNAFAMALAGNTKGLKQYGLAITTSGKAFDELVKQKIKDTGATEQQARSMAIYDKILEATIGKTGELGDQYGTLISMKKESEKFWQGILEDVSNLVSKGMDRLVASIKTVRDSFKTITLDELPKYANEILYANGVTSELMDRLQKVQPHMMDFIMKPDYTTRLNENLDVVTSVLKTTDEWSKIMNAIFLTLAKNRGTEEAVAIFKILYDQQRNLIKVNKEVPESFTPIVEKVKELKKASYELAKNIEFYDSVLLGLNARLKDADENLTRLYSQFGANNEQVIAASDYYKKVKQDVDNYTGSLNMLKDTTLEVTYKIDWDNVEKPPEKIKKTWQDYAAVVQDIFGSVNSIMQENIDLQDKLISKQEERVERATELAKEGNVKLLELETERLNKMEEKKRASLKNQRAMAQIEIALNTAIGISKALSNPPIGFFEVAMIIASMVSGIAASYKAASAVQGFKKGFYTGDGNPNDIAGVVHKREYVFDAQTTAANRPILDAMQYSRQPLSKMVEKLVFQMNMTHQGEMVKKLDRIERAILSNGMSLNIDSKGFTGRINQLNYDEERTRKWRQ
jgi:hypothetical protein